ncbi:MAG: hypothetical protein IIB57_10535 [Planctomycetes bacterium]|nr:hypothetical protein [Planctomycetota bacterium]
MGRLPSILARHVIWPIRLPPPDRHRLPCKKASANAAEHVRQVINKYVEAEALAMGVQEFEVSAAVVIPERPYLLITC